MVRGTPSIPTGIFRSSIALHLDFSQILRAPKVCTEGLPRKELLHTVSRCRIRATAGPPLHRPTKRCTAFSGSGNHGDTTRGWPVRLTVSLHRGAKSSPAGPVGTWSNPSRRRFLSASPATSQLTCPRPSLFIPAPQVQPTLGLGARCSWSHGACKTES